MFLTILTRTYLRPNLLMKNRHSLAVQTCKDFEQVIIADEKGIGIPATYKRLRDREASGDYVWIFDDDNEITDEHFMERAKTMAQNGADVLLFPSDRMGLRLAVDWPLQCGKVDIINVIVKKSVFDAHKKDFGERYEGDWDFINSILQDKPTISATSEVMLRAQRISMGQPE